MNTIIDPVRIYEVSGEVATVRIAPLAAVVANNQQVVAAITDYRIRVMGWVIQGSAAGFPTVQFKSNSAGTLLTTPIYVPNNAAGLSDKLPLFHSGYFETATGEGLFVDVTVAAANINVFWIPHRP